MTLPEACELFKPWLPVLVTLAGWTVVNHQNNQRETRKEVRAALDAAKRALFDAADVARHYHLSAGRDEAIEAAIKRQLDSAETELLRLPFYCSPEEGAQLQTRFARFSSVVTGGHFESADKTALPADAALIQELHAASALLARALEQRFTLLYHHSTKG